MRLVAGLALLGLVAGGCRPAGPAVANVRVEPASITPNGDGSADVARIAYEVGSAAAIRIVLRGADGQEHVFRDDEPRQPGHYEALFGGVLDGKMLPPGPYEVLVRGQPRGAGAPAEAAATLTIADADATPPTLQGFTADRSVFTPNQDGLGDSIHISFTVAEPLADFRMWLERADGERVTDIVQERETADDPTKPGAHDFRYDAGVDADAPPPPPGEYRIVAEARDAVGNLTRQTLPLTIKDSGKPSVLLKGDVDWSQSMLPLGGTLYFTATVQNAGSTPIRTRGPEPGFVYENSDSFNQVAPAEVLLLARAPNGGTGAPPASTSRRIPADRGDVLDATLDLARGAVLADGGRAWPKPPAAPATAIPLPGDDTRRTLRLCGTVVEDDQPVAGAEVYAFEADGDNGRRALADAQGHYCFEALEVPPSAERNYVESSGAMRLGVKYDDARQSTDYPYRWQLGRTAELEVCETEDRIYLCLPPGKQVQVTGGIRFGEPPYRRLTDIYTAILHEDVRVIQPGYGRARLTVEYD